MCRWADVSRAGYYKWRKRSVSLRMQKKLLVTSAVVSAFEIFKHRYGARRITVELNETGIDCSLNHIANIMLIKA